MSHDPATGKDPATGDDLALRLRNAVFERDAAHVEAAGLREDRDRARRVAVALEQELARAHRAHHVNQVLSRSVASLAIALADAARIEDDPCD